jgi:hypothetical protein
MNELTKLIAEFHATLAKFEAIAKRMEERESGIDPTMRDLPFPDGVIPPPLPEGKTRWIYRGTFMADDAFYVDPPRHIEYFSRHEKRWCITCHFSTDLHHIEAV